MRLSRKICLLSAVAWGLGAGVPAQARHAATASDLADEQARQVLAHMSLQDKMALLFSVDGGGFNGSVAPPGGLGSAAYLRAPPGSGLPDLQISDAGVGVRNPAHIRPNGAAVSLPSGLATASSWDMDMARQAGEMIGREAWRSGFNILLGGGADLTRDPRGGRNFEYAGEDPLQTGRMVGSTIAGVQSQHVISTLKHYAMNDLETSRMTMSADIDPVAMRESDLLGFEIAIETGHPGSVMCSYNRVNDLYACENPYLLNTTLKQDWHYPGFVMSDWGATHSSARAALAGLDQESAGDHADARPYFTALLAADVKAGRVPASRIDDMAQRIVRSLFAAGLVSHPPQRGPLDVVTDTLVAQHDEEEGAVLLRNEGGILPLSPTARIAVIGGHADAGVISGGGSSQVDPIGGEAVKGPGKKEWPGDPVYFPSSPLKAMRAEAPDAHITYESGTNIAAAVRAARAADVAVVYATQFTFEGMDAPSMHLDANADALITAVAAANPRTVVVMETGDPVLMPWNSSVAGVLEAWFPGSGGGPAIARLLFGKVAPSGHLTMTFPQAESQLAHPDIAGVTADNVFEMQFHTDQELVYDEGSDVGYRWFDRNHLKPLYPFGYGLTYTTFSTDGLAVHKHHDTVSVTFNVHNTGNRAGVDVPQVYVGLPDGGARRLAGWQRVSLAPGESREVTVQLDPRLLAHFDGRKDRWSIPSGKFRLWLADSAADERQQVSMHLPGHTLAP
ncbi:beta-glucosidase [Komagataeibacter medellinensis]|uniref:Beta-glucosidase n=1 Tax=Komagataeibacter medellinensis (strain NBRC 3288 / BCRC 11682 / LMG 1693 / Kondo 51) TaxID=634177 RepID=G2I1Y7_KOMMN|nr:glycoside hydrolase family 3 C-terminal domain-containing protein [Komagataeibacter medellinensis]BAK84923.1 beta-glucosidase [Komagataeibacter medellinensis NBRC 3288]